MPITINTRRLRTVGLASAIFTAGAGIGWQLADLIFTGEEPAPPMVAAIHFEGAQPHEAVRQVPASRVLPPATPADTSSALAEEARKLADAMQWAERYRREQGDKLMLAAAGNFGWAEVMTNAKRFGPGRYDVQKVIQAQIAKEQRQNAAQQVQVASAIGKADRALAPEATVQPVAHHTGSSVRKAARKPQGTVRRNARRPVERTWNRTHEVLCPLTWLQAVIDDLRMERHFRRHRA
jgi:hypothetical protein